MAGLLCQCITQQQPYTEAICGKRKSDFDEAAHIPLDDEPKASDTRIKRNQDD